MTFAEYDRYDGLGLAQLIRTGQVTAVEVVEAATERIERFNPTLNAVVLPLFEQALEAARRIRPAGGSARAGCPSTGTPGSSDRADSPFAGVPFLLKDLGEALAGVPLTQGSRAYRGFIPDTDSETVRRYKAAGLIILGKTNTPELGLVAFTEPELFGPCRNPWDPTRTPGGSSGGSAAAVAAGMVPPGLGRRRGRLDPHPRLPLRVVRPQAQPWPHPHWPRAGPGLARGGGLPRVDPHGAGQRRHAGRAAGGRPRCALRDPRP